MAQLAATDATFKRYDTPRDFAILPQRLPPMPDRREGEPMAPVPLTTSTAAGDLQRAAVLQSHASRLERLMGVDPLAGERNSAALANREFESQTRLGESLRSGDATTAQAICAERIRYYREAGDEHTATAWAGAFNEITSRKSKGAAIDASQVVENLASAATGKPTADYAVPEQEKRTELSNALVKGDWRGALDIASEQAWHYQTAGDEKTASAWQNVSFRIQQHEEKAASGAEVPKPEEFGKSLAAGLDRSRPVVEVAHYAPAAQIATTSLNYVEVQKATAEYHLNRAEEGIKIIFSTTPPPEPIQLREPTEPKKRGKGSGGEGPPSGPEEPPPSKPETQKPLAGQPGGEEKRMPGASEKPVEPPSQPESRARGQEEGQPVSSRSSETSRHKIAFATQEEAEAKYKREKAAKKAGDEKTA